MPTGIYVRTERTEEQNKKNSESKMGHLVSEETKSKISKALKGNKNNLGKHHSEETRRKISEVKKGAHYKSLSKETKEKMSESKKGEKNNNWKGGRTTENHRIRTSIEFRLWRKSIFGRDNFICQKCGQKGGILRAHHINNFADFPEIRLAIDNGIALCEHCHQEFHRKYGIKNNTKEQLEEFLKEV